MKLVLHIGPHKTGSSSIQKSFDQASDKLLQQGVIYFAERPLPAWSLVLKFATKEQRMHPLIRRHHPTDAQALACSERAWGDLAENVKKSDAKICVLSSEHFASLPAPSVQKLLTQLRGMFPEITVVAYARDPVGLYVSALQQNIQGGRRLNVLQTPSSFKYTFRKQITRYADALGWSNIVVRNFDRANLVGGDVVVDFLDVLAKQGVSVDIPSISVNESLPGAAIAWLLTVNETWARVSLNDERQAVINRLHNSERLAALPRLKLNAPDLENLITGQAADDLNWLNENCLQGQKPLRTAAIPEGILADKVQHAALRDWIMSYLDRDSMQLIAEDILET